MKEIKSIISHYDRYKTQGLKMALATVVNVEQSSYRRSGARMLITEDGKWVGGISGGCLEGDTLKKAKYAILKQQSTKVTYDTRDGDPNQIGVGLGCNGLIDVLISPISDTINPIDLLREIVDRREPSVLVTNLQNGSTNDYSKKLSKTEAINTLVTEVKQSQCSIMTNDGDGYFVEFIPPAISVYIFGKNYDVIPLATIIKEIGWNAYVVANPLKVSQGILTNTDRVIPPSNELKLDNHSVALLMSHDYATDKANLLRIHNHGLPYIGILGPKKRSIKLLGELKEVGNPIYEDNIFAPMGLDTGATTPEEIAISIVSEIRSVLSTRSGGHLRERKGSIH